MTPYRDSATPGWVLYLREPASSHESAVIGYGTRMDAGSAVARLVGPRICDEAVEVMYVLALNAKLQVVGLQEVSRGGLTSCVCSPRDVYRAAIVMCAHAIVLVHNHPSGDPTPSPEDVTMTHKLVNAGAVVGVELVDHVVIGSTGAWRSLRDLGIIT